MKGDSYSIYENPELRGTEFYTLALRPETNAFLQGKGREKVRSWFIHQPVQEHNTEIVPEITTAAIGTRIQILGEVCFLILWAREEFRFSLCLLSFCLHFCLLKYPAATLCCSGLVTCQVPTGVTVTSQQTPNWWIHRAGSWLQDHVGGTVSSLHGSSCWVGSWEGTRRARGWGHTLRAASLEWQPSQFGFSKNSCLQTLITVLAQHSEWFF